MKWDVRHLKGQPVRQKREKTMGPFLITLAFVTILVVTGIIVNMHLYDPGAKRFKRSRSLRPAAGRYTTGEAMSDAEYFTRLDTMYEEGPRYARRAMTMISFLVILIIMVGISFLGSIH
jgi:hypothetical protein